MFVPFSFQFTPLREGRPAQVPRWDCVQSDFNSRPSARGDRRPQCSSGTAGYFNSRPSARGDFNPQSIWIATITISIHAPPRGATRYTVNGLLSVKKFQFTPLREGRLEMKRRKGGTVSFQFTPLREGRRDVHGHGHRQEPISIHAPPRGATAFYFPFCRGYKFQFTPLREGRRTKDGRPPGNAYFNSRPSARGDKP